MASSAPDRWGQVARLGLVLLLLLCAKLSYAGDVVVFNANESKPFWSQSMKDGGMCGEIVHAASRAAGIKVSINFKPLQRMIEDDSNNDLGNPEFFVRNQEFSTIIPIALYHTAIFSYHLNHGHHVHSINDLKGHRIGILKGTLVDRSALERQGVVFEESYSQASLFKKLRKGRLDLVIEIDLVGQNIIDEHFADERDDFAIDIIERSAAPISMMVSMHQSNAEAVGASLREGMRKIRASGEYSTIVEKYYGSWLPDEYMRILDRFTMLYSFKEEE